MNDDPEQDPHDCELRAATVDQIVSELDRRFGCLVLLAELPKYEGDATGYRRVWIGNPARIVGMTTLALWRMRRMFRDAYAGDEDAGEDE